MSETNETTRTIHLSDNALAAVKEVVKALLAFAAVLTLWIQMQKTNDRVVDLQRKANENGERMERVETAIKEPVRFRQQ